MDELLSTSDLISLHCPMTPETEHLINSETIAKMKDGVILVNTSRGGLIKTDDLIAGIRDHKFFAVGLDVYEEESAYVYEDIVKQHSSYFHDPASSVLPKCNHNLTSGILYGRSTDQYCGDNPGKRKNFYGWS